MVTYDFNPRTLEAEAADLREFEASVVYKASSKPASHGYIVETLSQKCKYNFNYLLELKNFCFRKKATSRFPKTQ